MAQRLKSPIDKAKPTCGYKNEAYLDYYRFQHFGLDLISTRKETELYGLGDGYVFDEGLDGLNGVSKGRGSGCGYCLVVIYKDCINNRTGEVKSLAVTYMHMKSRSPLRKGDKVNAKTFLGNYGATGFYVTGPHLHIQMDTDVTHALHCCGIAGDGHNFLKRGTVDSTVNPCEWIWLDKGQSIKTTDSKWYTEADFKKIPKKPFIGSGRLNPNKMDVIK